MQTKDIAFVQSSSPTVPGLHVGRMIVLDLLLCFSLLLSLPVLDVALATQPSEPQAPLGARWNMSLQQVEQLPSLDRTTDGALRNTHRIAANSGTEFVAYWRDRLVTFLFAKDFGLYAIGIEMVPWLTQHTVTESDLELRDLQYNAPIRVAIATKYGLPYGVSVLWSAEEVTPLAESRINTTPYSPEGLIDWGYGRSWLVWRGATTRLALSDQSVWYASRDGLAHLQHLEQVREQEVLAEDAQETQREAARQRTLEQERRRVVSKAADFEAVF